MGNNPSPKQSTLVLQRGDRVSTPMVILTGSAAVMRFGGSDLTLLLRNGYLGVQYSEQLRSWVATVNDAVVATKSALLKSLKRQCRKNEMPGASSTWWPKQYKGKPGTYRTTVGEVAIWTSDYLVDREKGHSDTLLSPSLSITFKTANFTPISPRMDVHLSADRPRPIGESLAVLGVLVRAEVIAAKGNPEPLEKVENALTWREKAVLTVVRKSAGGKDVHLCDKDADFRHRRKLALSFEKQEGHTAEGTVCVVDAAKVPAVLKKDVAHVLGPNYGM